MKQQLVVEYLCETRSGKIPRNRSTQISLSQQKY